METPERLTPTPSGVGWGNRLWGNIIVALYSAGASGESSPLPRSELLGCRFSLWVGGNFKASSRPFRVPRPSRYHWRATTRATADAGLQVLSHMWPGLDVTQRLEETTDLRFSVPPLGAAWICAITNENESGWL